MPIKISAKKFEALVDQALEELPAFFKGRLQNIEVLIADRPTQEELEEAAISGHPLNRAYQRLWSGTAGYNYPLPQVYCGGL